MGCRKTITYALISIRKISTFDHKVEWIYDAGNQTNLKGLFGNESLIPYPLEAVQKNSKFFNNSSPKSINNFGLRHNNHIFPWFVTGFTPH